MSSTGLDPAALLRADGRLRALARELVRDPGEAEDLVQETWLAALEAGEIHSLPGWVATVVRRVALDRRREAKRRERREERAARPEAMPAAAEILEREEARRRVVEALLALEEPLRSTLILRFLEELPPRAVAARMGVPVETVRSRTRRGLAELRERLDRSFGQRGTWCAALLPLLRRPSAAEALSTALVVMSIQKKLALVVLVCALGWMAWPRRGGEAEPAAEPGSGGTALLQEPPGEEVAELVPAKELAARAEVPSPAKDAPKDPFGSLRVRVAWFDGTPAEGIAVYVQQGGENPELCQRESRTDHSGTALLSRVPAGSSHVCLDRGTRAPVTFEPGREASLELVIPRGLDVLGRVEDAEGVAISGAEVWSSWHGILLGGTLVARSGADGSFRLRSLRESAALGACAAGYRPSENTSVWGKEGSELTVRLVLRRGAGDVAGRVVDALTGLPVPGAFVSAGARTAMEAKGGGVLLDPWARTVRTGEDGSFRLTGLAPGSCSVASRAQGYALARSEVEVEEARCETVDLALLAEAALEGHVLDERGHPVSGVFVVVGQGIDWLRAVDQTDSDGRFHVGALEASATLEARIHREGQCIAATEFLALPGQTFVWEARLGLRGTIHGRVLDEIGQPLERWLVMISDDAGQADNATTDSDGGFRFENLEEAGHRLEVSFTGSLFPSIERRGVHPGEDEIVLRVPRERLPSVRIVGSFLDERGEPVPEAGAMPWLARGGNSTILDVDDATGRFSLGPFPAGCWRLHLTAPGRPPVFLGPHELAPGETWDCGEVRLAPEGRVVARLLAAGISLDEGLKLRIRQQGWWRSEGLGGPEPLLRSASLPPGSYELHVLGGSYDQVVIPFEIRSGAETTIDVPIRIGHPAVVRVKLGDPDVSALELCIQRADGTAALTRPISRAGDGDFVHTLHLAPGTYEVEAIAAGRRASGTLRVVPGDGVEAVCAIDLD